jgi:hypothetical protein
LSNVITYFKFEFQGDIMEVSVEIIRSPEFKQVYAIGAIGGHSPYDFRIAFYNDSPKAIREGDKSLTVMERKIETEIILSPLAAKELASWLNGHLQDYEKMFGEIKKPGEAAKGTNPDAPAQAQVSESAHIQGYM